MPRERHVFPTNEIAHLWAHQSQDEARNAFGNFYFSGDTIYSYGSHFPIARWAEGKDHARAVLLTTRDYSRTTAKHICYVREAIPSYVKVFHVPNPCDPHSYILESLVRQAKDTAQAATEARKPKSTRLLNEALVIKATAEEYAAFFGLKAPAFPFLPDGVELEQLKATLEEDRKRRERRIRRMQAAEERERIKREAEARAKWIAGENVYVGNPALLRVQGDEVLTSMGARFPMEHARRVLALIRALKDSGRLPYERNGHTIHLGHYAIDRVDADGTVYAGCHEVKWEEIERVAPEIEAAQVAA